MAKSEPAADGFFHSHVGFHGSRSMSFDDAGMA
jgi:hypothetical protein